MQPNEIPDESYTMTWTGDRGEVKFLRRSDGSRLRYFTTGTGPPLVVVALQLDVEAITVAGTGHFSALERPMEMVHIIRQSDGRTVGS
jgi:hypothetical protein